MLDAALDGIVVADTDGRILEFNRAAEATFRFARADVIGRKLSETIVPVHHRVAHNAGMRRVTGGGEPHVIGRRVEMEGLRADGEVFPLEIAIVRSEMAGQSIFVAYMRDITAAKTAERRLLASEERSRLAVEGAQLGTWSWDLKASTSWWSERARVIFGFPVDGEPSAEARQRLVHPDDAAAVAEVVRRVTQGEGEVALEYRIVRPDGEVRWVLTRGAGWRDETGEVVSAHGIVSDITARKAAEAELQRSREALHQSEKLAALGSMLAGVSHELNNPLSAVVGQSIMLEEDAAGTALAARAGKIRLAAERCARIVQTFLAIARQRRPERRTIVVEELILSALALTEYSLRTAGVVVRTAIANGLPAIEGQADLLQQVIVNLLLNAQQALEAQPQPREIVVTADRAKPCTVTIRIGDNGPGVSAAVAGRIFEPFFTTKPAGKGTGIGLSFSHGVIEAHGGQLQLVDDGAERGATFEIMLPATASSTPAVEPPRAALARPVSRGRALVVDDEAEVADTLADMLRRQHYEVVVASGGEAALAQLSGEAFDLICSDVRMPGMDGPALHDWIAEHRPELLAKLAFVTGDTLGAAAERFLESSGRPFLEKPFTPTAVAELAERVRQGANARA